MSGRLPALLLALLLALAACGAPPVDNEGPQQTVRDFVGALEDRDTSAILDLLEPTDWRKEIGPELRVYLGYVDALALDDPSLSVVENSGELATVRLTGTLRYALREGGASGEQPVDLLLELVRVDGQWYLRGLELPQPGA